MDTTRQALTKRSIIKVLNMYRNVYDIDEEIDRTSHCINKSFHVYIDKLIQKLSTDGYPVYVKVGNVSIDISNGFDYNM